MRCERGMDMFDVIIIGSGPAGLTAAIYAMRAGLKALVIEKSPMSGGQMATTYEVDNYPGLPGIDGMELAVKMREHAQKLGAEFVTEEVTGLVLGGKVREVQTTGQVYHAKSVLIATGASHALLGVLGEKELTGMGVSYCATCDGAFFRNKTAAVVGGGDVAVEDALFLAGVCEKVYLIHRRDELRAAHVLSERVKHSDKIEILWDTVVKEIRGEGRVGSILLEHVKSKEERELPVQGVFVAVGIRPQTEAFRECVETDEAGYVVAGEDGRTNVPGIYVAGDARAKKLRQIVTAVADGANAITSIQADLLHW